MRQDSEGARQGSPAPPLKDPPEIVPVGDDGGEPVLEWDDEPLLEPTLVDPEAGEPILADVWPFDDEDEGRLLMLLRRRLDALAADVGRLRRHLADESYGAVLLGRIAEHVQTIDVLIRPTAAEIFRADIAFGATEDEAVALALDDADDRDAELRRLLAVAERQP